MAYDEALAARVHGLLGRRKGFRRRRCSGASAFYCMATCVSASTAVSSSCAWVKEEASATMKEKYTKEFDITGKAMKGWVMVHDQGLGKDKRLKELAECAIRFVRTLPKK